MRAWKLHDGRGEMKYTMLADIGRVAHREPELADALERQARERALSFFETILLQMRNGQAEKARMLARLAGSAALAVQSFNFDTWLHYTREIARIKYGVTRFDYDAVRLMTLYRAGRTWDEAAAITSGNAPSFA